MFGLGIAGRRSESLRHVQERTSVAVAVLVVMAIMLGMPVSVMEVVNVVTMLDGFMAAVRPVDVLVLLVLLVLLGRCHLRVSIYVGRRFFRFAIYGRNCNAATPWFLPAAPHASREESDATVASTSTAETGSHQDATTARRPPTGTSIGVDDVWERAESGITVAGETSARGPNMSALRCADSAADGVDGRGQDV